MKVTDAQTLTVFGEGLLLDRSDIRSGILTHTAYTKYWRGGVVQASLWMSG